MRKKIFAAVLCAASVAAYVTPAYADDSELVL